MYDDFNATLVGEWFASTSVPDYLGAGYLHDGNSGQGSKSATWGVPSAGTYRVALWWSASNPGRASNVPVTITHAFGVATVTVDQRFNGAQWNVLGEYTFAASGTVTVSNTGVGTEGDGNWVTVDGIRFDCTPPPSPPPPSPSPSLPPPPRPPVLPPPRASMQPAQCVIMANGQRRCLSIPVRDRRLEPRAGPPIQSALEEGNPFTSVPSCWQTRSSLNNNDMRERVRLHYGLALA